MSKHFLRSGICTLSVGTKFNYCMHACIRHIQKILPLYSISNHAICQHDDVSLEVHKSNNIKKRGSMAAGTFHMIQCLHSKNGSIVSIPFSVNIYYTFKNHTMVLIFIL